MRFLVDQIGQRIAVGNQVYPATVTIGSNIHFAFFDTSGMLGNIHYIDSPGCLTDFTDPSPYQSYLNTWLTAAAADSPPLQLSQAIAIKAGLLQGIYAAKRNGLTSTTSVAGWATNVSSANGGNGAAPSNSCSNVAQYTLNGLHASFTTVHGQAPSLTFDTLAANGTKSYWEIVTPVGLSPPGEIGICTAGTPTNQSMSDFATGWAYEDNGNSVHSGSAASYGASYYGTGGCVIGVALDLVNDAIWFSLNGIWQNSATAIEIANGTLTHAAFAGLTGSYYPTISADAGLTTGTPVVFSAVINPPFTYAPPTGFGPVSGGAWDGSDLGTINLSAQVTAMVSGVGYALTTSTDTFTDTGSRNVQAITGVVLGPIGGPPTTTIYDTSGTAHTVGMSAASGLLTGISNQRNSLAGSYNSHLASLNACATIAAVIAYDATAGWPF
jgi:hypothetical protein